MSDGISISDTIAWAKPEDVGMSRDRLARLGERLEADIADGGLPGAVALVARRGRDRPLQGLWHGAIRRSPDPMQLDTIFRIYSMTKPITSVAAMMLVEEGRLDLGDPALALPAGLRGDEGARAPRRHGRATRRSPGPITIHDLLRHTSGLTLDWWRRRPVGPIYAEHETVRRSRTNAEQAALLAALPLACQPGERFVYGRSTDILGHIIELVTGEHARRPPPAARALAARHDGDGLPRAARVRRPHGRRPR